MTLPLAPVTARDEKNLAHYNASLTYGTIEDVALFRATHHFRTRRRTPADCADELDAISRHYLIRLPDSTSIACATLAPDIAIVAGILCKQRLRWLTVAPAYSHQGLAQALINIRLHDAHLFGAHYAWSDALASRVPLYVSLGAVSDEPTAIYDNDGTGEHLNVRYGPLPMTVPSTIR